MLIDFYDDSTGAIMSGLVRDLGPDAIPDAVKTANLVPADAFRDDKSWFAWPHEKKFACDTPEDTWLSAAYFSKTASAIPFEYRAPIKDALKFAASVHDLDVSTFLDPQAEVVDTTRYLITEKVASEDGPIIGGALPIHDAEATKVSAAMFGLDVVPESLHDQMPKVASDLMAACDEQGVPVPANVSRWTEAVKRSHVVDSIRVRQGIILDTNREADRFSGIAKAASARGVEMPGYAERPRFNSKFLEAFDELSKLAHEADLDSDFWGAYVQLDKLAGFDAYPGLAPVATMANRTVHEDLFENTVKLAGLQVTINEIMQKMAHDDRFYSMVNDLAPEAAQASNQRKFASALTSADPRTQQMIMVGLRGAYS